MLRTILALLALCLTTPALAQGVVGEWTIDLDALLKSPEMAKLPPEQREGAINMAKTMLSKMRMIVRADGTLSMQLNPTTARAGTWKADKGNTYTFTIDKDAAPAVLDGDTIKLTAGKTSMVFRRAGKAAPKAPSDPPIDFAGTWKVDLTATLATIADAGKRARMEKDAEQLKTMSITFNAGKMSMSFGGKTRHGTYTHTHTAKGVTRIETKEDGKGRTETLSLTRKGAALHVAAGNDTIVFTK